jgi:hypothetical protein
LAQGLQTNPEGHCEALNLLATPPGKSTTLEQAAPKDLADEVIVQGTRVPITRPVQQGEQDGRAGQRPAPHEHSSRQESKEDLDTAPSYRGTRAQTGLDLKPAEKEHATVRVLIASAPHADTFGYSMPPPGLLRLGGALEAAGHETLLEDLAFRQAEGSLGSGDQVFREAAELLAAQGPLDMLGLSVMGATLPAALLIAQHFRALEPTTPIVLGGPGASAIDVTLLERFDAIDVVVRGEGEQTLPNMLRRMAEGRDLVGVAGITRRDLEGRVIVEADQPLIGDLNELPPPAWHLVAPLLVYKEISGEDEGLVPIDSGRGCSYDCSFCSIGRYWNRHSRCLPPERLVNEILQATSLAGARQAYLCHDLFGANRKQALAFCAEMKKRGGGTPWECRARVDHLDLELLQAMAHAGCYRVLLGIESADPQVRRTNNKNTPEDLDPLGVLDDCATAKITPILSFILGLPGEDPKALALSLDLASNAALRAGVNLSFHLVNPQPGCELGVEFQGRTRRVEGIPPDMALGAGDSPAEQILIEAHPDVFSTWHQLPHSEEHLKELAKIARKLPLLLQRHARTFALLRPHLGLDSLALFRAWRATRRSFSGFVRSQADPLLDDVLAWEEAQIRQAQEPLHSAPGACHPDSRPIPAGEILRVNHDLSNLGPNCLRPKAEPTHMLVQRSPGALASTRTLKITEDIARVLEALTGIQTTSELESNHPGLQQTIQQLAEAGLVTTNQS